ncbi:hypothetical protein NLM24_43080 [Nocardia zapadnayensis]|nr:hypothetical protein [Nocardia zapadnayensis]MCX0277271.1 hypothetical protein [Nocardia zapadnayensis]
MDWAALANWVTAAVRWGTLADWVMAGVTLAGFAAAVVQLRINLSDSRTARKQARQEEEQNREAMARAVGLKSIWHPGSDGGPPDGRGLIPVEVEILNSGPYPIRNAVLELPTDDEDHLMEVVYGTILPGEHLKDTYEVPRTEVVFGEITGGATLKFTDTFDNHWSSSTSWHGLERIAEPPRMC